jgi:hypothetical protein
MIDNNDHVGAYQGAIYRDDADKVISSIAAHPSIRLAPMLAHRTAADFAAICGSLAALEVILSGEGGRRSFGHVSPDAVFARDGHFLNTPLHLASSRSTDECAVCVQYILEWLTEAGRDTTEFIDLPGWRGMTPLHCAAIGGSSLTIIFLTHYGADVHRLAGKEMGDHRDPLSLAKFHRDLATGSDRSPVRQAVVELLESLVAQTGDPGP